MRGSIYLGHAGVDLSAIFLPVFGRNIQGLVAQRHDSLNGQVKIWISIYIFNRYFHEVIFPR